MANRFDLHAAAKRLVGTIKERPGGLNHPFILWAHELCRLPIGTPDEVAWCSSGINALAFVLGLPRSNSARARSWLEVGSEMALVDAQPGDIAIFKRGTGGGSAGPEVIEAPGHVAVFDTYDSVRRIVNVYGGNQNNQWSAGKFMEESLLGIRRIG